MPGICPECHDKVYAAEEVFIRGNFWHKSCFRCSQCRKRLDNSSNHQYISDEVFCIICFKKFSDQENRKRLHSDNVDVSDNNSVYSTPPTSAETRNSRSRFRESLKPRSKSAGRILDNPNFRFIKSIEERTLIASANFGSKKNAYKSAEKPVYSESKHLFSNDNSNSTKKVAPIVKEKVMFPRDASPVPIQTFVHEPQLILRRTFNFPGRSPRSSPVVTHDVNANNPKKSWTSVQAQIRETRVGSKLEICNKCRKEVYQAEMCKGAGAVWHKNCFLCDFCGRRLDSSRLCERGQRIFCNSCYHRNFGPRGIGYGIGANFQT